VGSRVVAEPQPAALYVVSTPIGNMGDFSFRAVEVLRSVAVILAEDTRHSRHLLDRYEITTPLSAYHEHNEARALPGLVARMAAGESMALITDAGTPIVSDPGARLVRGAIDAGIRVIPVPGASALLAAVVASGIPADRFTFLGFLPRKGRERREALDLVRNAEHAVILYEAPSRVADTLADIVALGAPERPAAVARELTKHFEEIQRGTVSDLAAYYKESPPRGEVVIVLDGAPAQISSEESLRPQVERLRAEGMSTRDIIAALVQHGASRNVAYRLAHEP
jgi:16S rRNA (cytidine1402-2'-O)-methyltransferase